MSPPPPSCRRCRSGPRPEPSPDPGAVPGDPGQPGPGAGRAAGPPRWDVPAPLRKQALAVLDRVLEAGGAAAALQVAAVRTLAVLDAVDQAGARLKLEQARLDRDAERSGPDRTDEPAVTVADAIRALQAAADGAPAAGE